jgi:Ras family protein
MTFDEWVYRLHGEKLMHGSRWQDEFSILSSKHGIGLHGWVLVYSVTSRNSFEMVSTIRDKILSYTGVDSVPMVIVGNKSDLEIQRCASR